MKIRAALILIIANLAYACAPLHNSSGNEGDDVDIYFTQNDKDHSKYIDLKEFIESVPENIHSENRIEYLSNTFRCYDINQNKQITKDEMRSVIKNNSSIHHDEIAKSSSYASDDGSCKLR